MSASYPRVPEPLRTLARAARRSRWGTITHAGSGHLRWRRADGLVVITPSTPGGGNRSVKNARAALKRAGLEEENT